MKKLLGEFSLLAVKNKRELITSNCSTKAAIRTCKHGRQYDENNIFSSTERREGCSVITEAGLMMCADEDTPGSQKHFIDFNQHCVLIQIFHTSNWMLPSPMWRLCNTQRVISYTHTATYIVCSLFINFIFVYKSTCFGQVYCPSSGV